MGFDTESTGYEKTILSDLQDASQYLSNDERLMLHIWTSMRVPGG